MILYLLLQSKREAFDLPDGADLLVGSVRTNFACPQGAVGYFADTDNDCKIFHVCNTIVEEDGSGDTQQYSFLCGNQTVSTHFIALSCYKLYFHVIKGLKDDCVSFKI